MRTYNVNVKITDAWVSFDVKAESPEDALKVGRESLKKTELFHKDIEVVDSSEEIIGVLEA